VLGRSKYLRRSILGGIALSKKCERNPRNRLAGRIKVLAFNLLKMFLVRRKRNLKGKGPENPI
jgi:hypothetical protein